MAVVEPDCAIARADAVVDSYGGEKSSLIHVLQDIQQELDYLPAEALRQVADRLGEPLAEVLRVATFYAAFSLEPRGEHLICVCMGTACHVRGAPRILDAVRRKLGLGEGEVTSSDMRFTVKTVRCLGCCALAPAITVDEDTHGLLTPERVPDVLKEYE